MMAVLQRFLTSVVACTAMSCSTIGPPEELPADASPADASSADAPPIDAGVCPPDWWDCAFAARQPLVIDYSAGAENLTNVPVLVVLGDARADTTLLTPESLRFVDDAGTELVFDMDGTVGNAGLAAWVRIPELVAGTSPVITAYYGNGGVVSVEAPGSVWGGYAGVWHMGEDPNGVAPQMLDSTGNGNLGTTNGMVAGARVPGQIGDALVFDGVDDFVQVPDSTSLDIKGTSITLSAWVNMTNLQLTDNGVIVKSDVATYNYQLGIESNNVGNFRVFTDQAITPLGRIDTVTQVTAGAWYYVAGVYDGVNVTAYLNGALETTAAHTGAIQSIAEPLLFGRRALSDPRFFDGIIDEVRVSDVARTAAWIQFQYLSGTDQIIDYGAVETY